MNCRGPLLTTSLSVDVGLRVGVAFMVRLGSGVEEKVVVGVEDNTAVGAIVLARVGASTGPVVVSEPPPGTASVEVAVAMLAGNVAGASTGETGFELESLVGMTGRSCSS